jgi:hypothetical protein
MPLALPKRVVEILEDRPIPRRRKTVGQTSRSTFGWIAALTVTEIVKEVKQARTFTLPPF